MPFQVTRGSPSAAGASTEAKHALICLRDVSRVLHVARATKFLHRDGKDLVIIPFIQSSSRPVNVEPITDWYHEDLNSPVGQNITQQSSSLPSPGSHKVPISIPHLSTISLYGSFLLPLVLDSS